MRKKSTGLRLWIQNGLCGFALSLFLVPAVAHEKGGALPVSAQITLARKQMHERCYDLQAGQMLSYRFESGKKLSFNLHYHQNGDEYYLVHYRWSKGETGTVEIPVSTEICAMWENRAFGSPAILRYSLKLSDNEETALTPAP